MNSYIDNPAHWLFDPPFFNPDESSRPLTILELGSGTGVVAAHCAPRLTHQGHTLVVTDLPEVCPLLQRNLQQYLAESHHRPSAPKVLVRPLSWGNNEHACNIAAELGYCSHDAASSACYLTHVICSDLVSPRATRWWTCAVRPIFDSFSYHRKGRASALLALPTRLKLPHVAYSHVFRYISPNFSHLFCELYFKSLGLRSYLLSVMIIGHGLSSPIKSVAFPRNHRSGLRLAYGSRLNPCLCGSSTNLS